ncbi:PTS system ascorbate-specific IIB component [Clostridium tetanomorphum]|uniref:MtlR transcriptional regulator n=1 Tax=Clostridium tetanomorphum TaxID=1553 RepID=A0A923ED96_CLOTT|nr:MtlR transcriptional regulator [Clostridium tetanomorphum]KAJ52169.1 phosphotransferase system galactitol-specific transporter subunit IIB [Clostridium tetanomorphum DSM 665]MBC2399919.1 MtlR transcriptional regulator [Clostridium tetanomorphum]MBP1866434.1 PTS system ascorbate-specific IIB component [Clostridium tetanomorphum]NRS86764.1 PTS system ascorbate-specific IIB component [Clostridium tetanomorphum]NRZ99481.1 PTS system ascorbate-specific IIB component [Clostridium tetanomorphum]
MLNIVVVCSLGLGSSFIIESNVRMYFKDSNIKYNVLRCDITTAEFYEPDIYICSEDINFNVDKKNIEKIELEDLLDKEELSDKLTSYLKSRGI